MDLVAATILGLLCDGAPPSPVCAAGVGTILSILSRKVDVNDYACEPSLSKLLFRGNCPERLCGCDFGVWLFRARPLCLAHHMDALQLSPCCNCQLLVSAAVIARTWPLPVSSREMKHWAQNIRRADLQLRAFDFGVFCGAAVTAGPR